MASLLPTTPPLTGEPARVESRPACCYFRMWKRFHGITEEECEEADQVIGSLNREGYEFVKWSERGVLRPGQASFYQWFSITTGKCAQAFVCFCTDRDLPITTQAP